MSELYTFDLFLEHIEKGLFRKEADWHKTIPRWCVLQALFMLYKYKSYLEIGIGDGSCLKQMAFIKPVSVDIKADLHNYNHRGTHHTMSSDEFFEKAIKEGITFDLIFIDGDHNAEVAYRDLQNSYKVLNPFGTIVMHDTDPSCYEDQTTIPTPGHSVWNGDVWKVVLKERITNRFVSIMTIDTDSGCTLIQPIKHITSKGAVSFENEQCSMPYHDKNVKYTYNYFAENKQSILNLISVKRLVDLLKGEI